jgi:hypothetical protein
MRQDTNSTGAVTAAAAMGTFEGQISGSLSTLGFLMLAFLYNGMYDRSGTAVLFPLPIVTVQKSTVRCILEAGTWMKTEVDGQVVVLVPKRVDPVGAESMEVLLERSGLAPRDDGDERPIPT